MPLAPPQAFRKVENLHRIGLAADRPLAADVLPGTLYFSTDTEVIERSDGTTWDAYSDSGGSSPVVETYVSNTDTGTKTAWAPGVSGNTAIHWSGASDITLQGITGGTAGLVFRFKNTGTKWAWFTHASGSASASDRLTNIVTSSLTPVAPGGWIAYQHDGTNWKLIDHQQGAVIETAFSAANFTASVGNWTLAAGDQIALQWKVNGTKVAVNWALNTTTTSSTPQQLRIGNGAWGGFTVKVAQALNGCVNNIPGLGILFGFAQTGSAVGTTNQIWIFKSDATNFPAAVDTLYTYGSLEFEVT